MVAILGVGTCAAQTGTNPAQATSSGNDLPASPIGTQGNPLNAEIPSDAGISNQPAPPTLPVQDPGPFALADNDAPTQMRVWQAYMVQEMQMMKDSRKLLEMANKLNAEVAAQHGAPLTPAERKEVAAIEKLAHSVRTKMQAPVPPIAKTMILAAH